MFRRVKLDNTLLTCDQGISAWDGLSATLSDKLQKLQNRAVKVIIRSSCDTHVKSILDRLSWDNLSTRRTKLKAVLMFQIIKGLALLTEDFTVFKQRLTEINRD